MASIRLPGMISGLRMEKGTAALGGLETWSILEGMPAWAGPGQLSELRTTLVGSEAGEAAPEVGLGDTEEASSLEDRWGLLPASPSVSTEAEGLGEGQGWLSRRQCGQLRGRLGNRWSSSLGNRALWLHSLCPSSTSSFLGGRGGTEGVVEEAEREKSHTLCTPVNLAVPVRSGHSFLSVLGRLLGLI